MNSLAVIVVDRSGSMHGMWKEAESVVNEALESARKIEGAFVRIVEFDNVIEDKGMRSAKYQEPYSSHPRGSTALYDAIGQAIDRTGKDLAALPLHERPANILVTIVTDGEENSSKEYTYEKIQSMIKHQKDKYNWQFMFASSNLKSVTTANAWGIQTIGGWVPGNPYSYAANSVARNSMMTSYMTSGSVDEAAQKSIRATMKEAV